jgi:hypothetical protein
MIPFGHIPPRMGREGGNRTDKSDKTGCFGNNGKGRECEGMKDKGKGICMCTLEK